MQPTQATTACGMHAWERGPILKSGGANDNGRREMRDWCRQKDCNRSGIQIPNIRAETTKKEGRERMGRGGKNSYLDERARRRKEQLGSGEALQRESFFFSGDSLFERVQYSLVMFLSDISFVKFLKNKKKKISAKAYISCLNFSGQICE